MTYYMSHTEIEIEFEWVIYSSFVILDPEYQFPTDIDMATGKPLTNSNHILTLLIITWVTYESSNQIITFFEFLIQNFTIL